MHSYSVSTDETYPTFGGAWKERQSGGGGDDDDEDILYSL
jgi:hypothetical protein